MPADPLSRRMEALGIREEDLEESFVRSSGHGGQNVNKVSTCVVLVHKPSGLTVRCQESRQQAWNRARARELLLDRIEESRRSLIAAAQAQREKARRQKRPRSRASKERMLADKARRAGRKSLRGPRGVPRE